MNFRRWELLASLGLIAVVLTPAAGQQRGPATLRGSITDGHRPLAAATVRIFGLDRTVMTSEEGAFRFDSLAPGRYWVGVRRIGYVPGSFTVTLLADSVRDVTISLEAAPYRLSDLEVSGGMTPYRFRDFEWRSRGAWGRLYTRDDIRRSRPFDLIDLVQRGLPGHSRFGLEQAGLFDPTPRWSTVEWSTGFGSSFERMNRDCAPGISLNGSSPWPGVSLRDYQLEDIEAVEVYRNATNVPIEFARAASCGLVVLWLR
jgi:hypothetical protein